MRDVITAALRCTFGLESSQMSLLLFLTIVKSAGGVNTLMEATEVELISSIILNGWLLIFRHCRVLLRSTFLRMELELL